MGASKGELSCTRIAPVLVTSAVKGCQINTEAPTSQQARRQNKPSPESHLLFNTCRRVTFLSQQAPTHVAAAKLPSSSNSHRSCYRRQLPFLLQQPTTTAALFSIAGPAGLSLPSIARICYSLQRHHRILSFFLQHLPSFLPPCQQSLDPPASCSRPPSGIPRAVTPSSHRPASTSWLTPMDILLDLMCYPDGEL
ncbi:uncharacterized protein LOC110028611 [Phalaenopsis equestris]|uniref:uncharacterized protein LOC110028611 n=1 Tax=Phalaenopsis equestris TaxID=78828 RepID=UPI0009E49304|nr:uncharacterized protein LOC110028611 [Phalaenopsis equestris]